MPAKRASVFVVRACSHLPVATASGEPLAAGLLGISATVLGNLGADATFANADGAPSPPPASPPSSRPVQGGPLLFVLFALAVLMAHVVLLKRWRTCSVSFITKVRLCLLGLAGYGLIVALFMLLMPWEGWLVVLIVTWSLVAAGLVGWAIYRVYFAEVPGQPQDNIREAASG